MPWNCQLLQCSDRQYASPDLCGVSPGFAFCVSDICGQYGLDIPAVGCVALEQDCNTNYVESTRGNYERIVL